MKPAFRWAALAAILILGWVGPAGAQARRPGVKPPARPAAAPAPLTPARLGAMLKALGYASAPHGAFQRLRVEEDGYGYFLDFGISKSGDWLVAMAHLASVGDLTKLRATPLLNLLATNDRLLGMSFSYDRANGRIMLNASVPTRTVEPGALRNMVVGMRSTIQQTQDLWDSANW